MTDPGEAVSPLDERRHGGVDERWWFDFAAPDGSMGGYACLAFHPAARTAWYWAAFVATRRPLLTFRAHDIPIPAKGTEVRGDGVWACLTCETPLEHWSVGLESFGVELDDPIEAWRGERGDVVPFGLDLEWEATAPPAGWGSDRAGYGQWCEVHGEVLVGDERIEVACTGHRHHTWGSAALPPWRVAVPGLGCWLPGRADLVTTFDGDGLPRSAALLEPGRAPVELSALFVSPVAVPGVAVVHGLCVGGGGAGWVSWACTPGP